ncbi:ABC transporter ATP-binding protein [Enterovibrio calviensis]|uniref:ABC transporter ATP-binding protein n=1 Tax=Enterovibrio calviensis TaxID=91359 RepID=UPI003734CC6E
MLRAENLSFCVDGKELLKPINYAFEPGKIYALVGHNGSGKSTLLKLLAQQQKPTAGQITLFDRPAKEWSNKRFAKNVAYLPQHLSPTDSLSSQDLVSFGRYPWHGLLGRLTQEDKDIVEEAMIKTDTLRYADRLVDSLSGGERQRVWLAMLLAQKTKYLLLDEPLSALDIAHQMEMLSLIKSLSRDMNLGVVIVIHDINMAARFCDHIVAMHSGSLITDGGVNDVLTVQSLKHIYGIDMHVSTHPLGYPVAVPC